jgi:hypothetical protein
MTEESDKKERLEAISRYYNLTLSANRQMFEKLMDGIELFHDNVKCLGLEDKLIPMTAELNILSTNDKHTTINLAPKPSYGNIENVYINNDKVKIAKATREYQTLKIDTTAYILYYDAPQSKKK